MAGARALCADAVLLRINNYGSFRKRKVPCTTCYFKQLKRTSVRFTYTAHYVLHNMIIYGELGLRLTMNHHIITRRCCYMQLCMWFCHICRAGRAFSPSRLPPEIRRGTFVSCVLVYIADVKSARIISKL